MHSRRTAHRPLSQINVVPYIDVMLVLLVIFMVTAPMMNPGQIDLPSVGKSATPAAAPLEVMVKKDATLVLRDHARGGAERPVSQDELTAMLKQKLLKNPEQAVVISADKKIRYEEVIKVMDMLQQQSVKKVGLLTRTR